MYDDFTSTSVALFGPKYFQCFRKKNTMVNSFSMKDDCAKQALENDIPVVLGNDVGCPWVSQYDFWREHYFRKYIGVSNRFAYMQQHHLLLNTLVLENITGSNDVGKDADMIVVSENPFR